MTMQFIPPSLHSIFHPESALHTYHDQIRTKPQQYAGKKASNPQKVCFYLEKYVNSLIFIIIQSSFSDSRFWGPIAYNQNLNNSWGFCTENGAPPPSDHHSNYSHSRSGPVWLWALWCPGKARIPIGAVSWQGYKGRISIRDLSKCRDRCKLFLYF